MRNFKVIALLFTLLLITACGGNNSSSGSGSAKAPSVPIGVVAGAGFDGLLINSDINIYDFTTGAKGALLAHAVSDNSGLYSVNLQIESRPILIEATGGYYMEEAGSGFQVKLTTAHKLSALANFVTGAVHAISATNYTHLAAGLAEYEISKGTAVATAINDANGRISAVIGVDILATTPRQITDPANTSAALTPELRYGFLSGGISMWTYNNTPSTGLAHKIPYTSIDFADTMYQDVLADGLLDGKGAAGAALSFGTTPLTSDIYRLGVGVSMLQMAGNVNNKTGLNGAALLPYVQSFIASTDLIFNNVVPTSISAPVVNLTSPAANAVLMNSIILTATTRTAAALSSVELLVDTVSVSTASNLASPSFAIVTSNYPDGPHKFGVRATDIGGLVTTTSIPVLIVNAVPSVTIASPADTAILTGAVNVTTSLLSSVGLNKVELLIDGVSSATATNFVNPTFQIITTNYVDGAHTIAVRVTDIGGQVVTKTIAVTIANIAPALTLTAPTARAFLRGALNVTGTVSSKSGLQSIEMLVDGVSAGTATSIASPASPAINLVTTNYPDGAHTVGIRATDIGGLVSSQSVSVVFDNYAPVVTVTAPTAAAYLRGIVNVTSTTQSVAGVAKNEILVDGLLVATATSLTAPAFMLNTALYLDGNHIIGVRSTDIGGLVTTTTVPVVFDNVAPVVTITAPASSAILSAGISVTSTTQSVVGLRQVDFLFDGNIVGTATNLQTPTMQIVTTSYPDGAHTIAVQATDMGGLITTTTIPVTIANVAPALTLTSPAANAVLRGTSNVAATSISLSGIVKAELMIDGVSKAIATNPAAPTFSLNSLSYGDGAHVVGIRATDIGGLVTMVTVPVLIDNNPPVVFTGVTSGSWASTGINATGDTETSIVGISKVEYLIDGSTATFTPWSMTLFGRVISWKTFSTAALGEGVHMFQVRATDIGGLVTTGTSTFSVDHTPPTLNIYTTSATTGYAYDNLSGAATVTNLTNGVVAPVNASTGLFTFPSTSPITAGNYVVRDNAGNCTNYYRWNGPAYYFSLSTNPC